MDKTSEAKVSIVQLGQVVGWAWFHFCACAMPIMAKNKILAI